MITELKVVEVTATRNPDKQPTAFDVLFNIESVKAEGGKVTIGYVYTAEYAEKTAKIVIRGVLKATEDAATIKSIEESMKEKRMATEYFQRVLNTINYFGTTQATLIATSLGIVPPIKMPGIKITESKAPAAKPAKK
jgi:hypothetical protein